MFELRIPKVGIMYRDLLLPLRVPQKNELSLRYPFC